MFRFPSALVAAAVLALPATAAAAPVPGAHYEGTNDNGIPFSFDVTPDGAGVTNVTGSTTPFCTGGGGFQPTAIASTFVFPVAGDTISGEDADGFPRLTLTGTFSGSQASGTFQTNHGYLQNGLLVVCNSDDAWTARTSAAGGGTGTTTPGPGAAVAPVISLSFPKGVKLLPSLSNGFVVTAGVDRAATLTGTATLGAKDAKRYGLGKKARVIAKDKTVNAGPDSGLEFVPSRPVAKKLRKARKLTLTIDAVAITADGARSTARKKVTLTR